MDKSELTEENWDALYQQHKTQLQLWDIGFPQDDNEFQQLLRKVEAIRPQVFVEIGTRCGGSLWMIAQYLPASATVISIDLSGAAWGRRDSLSKKEQVAQHLRQQELTVHLLEMDSHDAKTLQSLQQILAASGGAIDFLFIDGDHSWEGVLRDWELYHSLVRPGGLIGFHDIVHSSKTPQVKVGLLWDVLKTIYLHEEFITRPEHKFGIGILCKS